MSAAENTTSASTTVVSSQQPPPPPGEWLYSNVVQSNTQSNAASVQPMAWQTAQANYYSVPPPVPQPLPAASYVPQPWPPNGQNPAMSISQRAPSQSSASNIPQTQPRNMTPLPPTMNPVYVPHYYAQAPGTDQQYMVPHPPWMGYHNAYYPIPPPHAIPVPQPLQSTGSTQTSSQADFPSYPSAMDVQNYQEQYHVQIKRIKRSRVSCTSEDEVLDLIPTSRNFECRVSSEESPEIRRPRLELFPSDKNLNWEDVCGNLSEVDYRLIVRNSDIADLTRRNSSLIPIIRRSAIYDDMATMSPTINDKLEEIQLTRSVTLLRPPVMNVSCSGMQTADYQPSDLQGTDLKQAVISTNSESKTVQTDSHLNSNSLTKSGNELVNNKQIVPTSVISESKAVQTDGSIHDKKLDESASSEECRKPSTNSRCVQVAIPAVDGKLTQSVKQSNKELSAELKRSDRFKKMTTIVNEILHPFYMAFGKAEFLAKRAVPLATRNSIFEKITIQNTVLSDKVLPFVIDSERRPKCKTLVFYEESFKEKMERVYFANTVHISFDDDFSIDNIIKIIKEMKYLKKFKCLNIDFSELMLIYFIKNSEKHESKTTKDIFVANKCAHEYNCRLAFFYVQERDEGEVSVELRKIGSHANIYTIKAEELEVLQLSSEKLSVSKLIYIDILMSRTFPDRIIMVDERLAVDLLIQSQSLEILNKGMDYPDVTSISCACSLKNTNNLTQYILEKSSDSVCWPDLKIESPSYRYDRSVEDLLKSIRMSIEFKYTTDFRHELFNISHPPEIKAYSALWVLSIFLTRDKNLVVPINENKLKELCNQCQMEIAVCKLGAKLKNRLLYKTDFQNPRIEKVPQAIEKYFIKLLEMENECGKLPMTLISHRLGIATDDINVFSEVVKRKLYGITWNSKFRSYSDRCSPLSTQHLLKKIQFSTMKFLDQAKTHNVLDKNKSLFRLLENKYPEHIFIPEHFTDYVDLTNEVSEDREDDSP